MKAQAAKKLGNTSLIKKFVTHDQAESYNRLDHEAAGSGFTIPSADYEFADVGTEEFRRRFPIRIMGCDRQLGRREIVIRAYGREGSRLVWTGITNDKQEMRQRQLDYGVRMACSFRIARGTPRRSTRSAGNTNGRPSTATTGRNGRTRPMPPPRADDAALPAGLVGGCWRVSWSNPTIKNTVYLLRTRQGMKDDAGQLLSEYWGLPKDRAAGLSQPDQPAARSSSPMARSNGPAATTTATTRNVSARPESR